MAKLFGAHIEPACAYCACGAMGKTEGLILCPKKGLVSPSYHCRRFVYDPLKRIPKKTNALPDYRPEDFKL